MSTLPKALTDMLEPVVQLERLAVWADAESSHRFFEMTRYRGGWWDVTLYFRIAANPLTETVSGTGDSLVEAINNVFDELERQE